MNFVKTAAFSLFIITIGFICYLLRYSFKNPYFILGLAVLILLLIILNFYMNGGTNYYQPNLNGKIIIITGANVGLGFESCKNFASLKPRKVILACRNELKATNAIKLIQ